MSPSEQILLAKAVIIIIVICASLLFLKFGLADESSDFSGEPKLLQETSDELLLRNSENLSAERRRELLEKIKEERIMEYLYQKNNLPVDTHQLSPAPSRCYYVECYIY